MRPIDEYLSLSKMIDHALLTPTATEDELVSGVRLARAFDVASVCILPYFVPQAASLLLGSGVVTSTTIGFPHGGQKCETKLKEADLALGDGAQELDVVVNLSAVKSGRYEAVTAELSALTALTHGAGQKLKVIFENCFLTTEEKVQLCKICGELGVDWVKTSTGYGSGGATHEDLRLMREHSPPHVQVKAAGGIRTLAGLREVKALGVTRVGASATAAILGELREQLGLAPILSAGVVSTDQRHSY